MCNVDVGRTHKHGHMRGRGALELDDMTTKKHLIFALNW